MRDDGHLDALLSNMNEVQILQSEPFREQLVVYINHLLLHDFNTLIQLLYKVDIDEQKLKTTLHQKQGIDAARLIADLLIQRQSEKLKSKHSSSSKDSIPDDERW